MAARQGAHHLYRAAGGLRGGVAEADHHHDVVGERQHLEHFGGGADRRGVDDHGIGHVGHPQQQTSGDASEVAGAVAAHARQVEQRPAGVDPWGEDQLERRVLHVVQAEPGGLGIDHAEPGAQCGAAEVGVLLVIRIVSNNENSSYIFELLLYKGD